MGATNTLDRVAASLGQLNGVAPEFTVSLDVQNGGVLFTLPALLVSGLLSHSEKYFQLPKGYYGLDSVFMLLAFMAIARIKTVENLRFEPPGEWGKILGLDRIPEAKTLREKVALLSGGDQPYRWASELSMDWMTSDPASASVLYIDGHVRVYSGSQAKLPRHYVARQKLCLRATCDYWVNAMDGQPFFVINQAVDPGLLTVLKEEIVPRLENEIPDQPTKEQLESDPFLHRFILIFDREGYSPDFMLSMKKKRIACATYHKYPEDDWREDEFVSCRVTLVSGNIVEMKLAERGTCLGGKVWVREIRKLTESGHQTSIVSTDYKSDLQLVAAAMFARWSQENFFKYMRNHYNIDRLVDYSTEEISDTTKVVNPEYRRLDSEVRKKVSKLTRKKAFFGSIILKDDIEPKKVEEYEQKKADLTEEISHLEKEVNELKANRKGVKKHITIAELPEDQRFTRLGTQSKYLVDTIKMIDYRAETSMANLLREKMNHKDEARSLLRAIYNTEADILPDMNSETLTVRLHHLANKSSSESIRYLCDELNATETVFPGTKLRLIYKMVS